MFYFELIFTFIAASILVSGDEVAYNLFSQSGKELTIEKSKADQVYELVDSSYNNKSNVCGTKLEGIKFCKNKQPRLKFSIHNISDIRIESIVKVKNPEIDTTKKLELSQYSYYVDVKGSSKNGKKHSEYGVKGRMLLSQNTGRITFKQNGISRVYWYEFKNGANSIKTVVEIYTYVN